MKWAFPWNHAHVIQAQTLFLVITKKTINSGFVEKKKKRKKKFKFLITNGELMNNNYMPCDFSPMLLGLWSSNFR